MMGGSRLAGFTYRKVVRRLRKLGVEYKRDGRGSHEIWLRPSNQRTTTIPRHSDDLNPFTLQGILTDLDLTVDEFLDA